MDIPETGFRILLFLSCSYPDPIFVKTRRYKIKSLRYKEFELKDQAICILYTHEALMSGNYPVFTLLYMVFNDI